MPASPAGQRLDSLQRTLGNSAVASMWRSGILQRQLGIQAKSYTVGPADDPLETAADKKADEVMAMRTPLADAEQAMPARIQRECDECETETAYPQRIQRINDGLQDEEAGATTSMYMQRNGHSAGGTLASDISADIDSLRDSGGLPLPTGERNFFEPRFNRDFSDVRVHSGPEAAKIARQVNARAFTIGRDVVFGANEYRPGTEAGRRLMAHELTHTVQQGAGKSLQRLPPGQSPARINREEIPGTLPGDGLKAPGDCSWPTYLRLRGAVESAKAMVQLLGGCKAEDSCLRLALKIAAGSAEIAARGVIMGKCFRGGDKGHNIRVRNLSKMISDCHIFFVRSGCSPDLIEQMKTVVAHTRRAAELAAIGAAAVVFAAAVVALVAALAVLIKAIAAAAAAMVATAAGAAAIGAAAAALLAIVFMLNRNMKSGGSSNGGPA